MKTILSLSLALALMPSAVFASNLIDDWFGQGGYGNGNITREVYDSKFSSMDSNKDGKISPSEQDTFRTSGTQWFIQGGFDANADGFVTRDEYQGRFATIDSNNDGRISMEERSAFQGE